jgi:sec-independent protein translocase protein TatA
MPFGNVGFTGLLLIIIFALIIFGPTKLPALGRALGRTIKEFRNTSREVPGKKHEHHDHS